MVRHANSIIEIKGADNEDGLRGSGLDYLVMDECQDFKPHIWDEILSPMLVGANGKALLIGTKKPSNWYRNLWLKIYNNEFGDEFKALYYPSTSNPTIPASEWDREKKTKPEHIWLREYISDPRTVDGDEGGSLYPEFSRLITVIPPMIIPPNAEVFRSIDWGISHPTVCLWGALINKKVYIFDEYVAKELSVEQHARIIKEKTDRQVVIATAIDPSCMRREGPALRSIAGEFAMNGIPTIPTAKETKDFFGVNCVKKFLKVAEDGKPSCLVFSTCHKLIQKMETIRWEDTEGDDETDALKYLLLFINDHTDIFSGEVPEKPFYYKERSMLPERSAPKFVWNDGGYLT